MDRRTSLSFLISLLIHALPLILLSLFNLPLPWGRLVMVNTADETPPPRSNPIQVDIVEARPEVRRPLFGRDSITRAAKPRRMVARLNEGIGNRAAAIPTSVDAREISRPPETKLNLIDPESFMGIEEPSMDGLSEPDYRDNGGSKEEKRSENEGDNTGSGDVESQMSDRLQRIAAWMGSSSKATEVDVAFILDTSGSMEDNIKAVGNHLDDMAASLKSSGLDYRVAVVKFRYLRRDMLVFPFTRDVDRYRRLLRNVRCYGDERALDALDKAMDQLQFRRGAKRHFILVTDEPLKGSPSFIEVLNRCRRMGIAVTVIGIDDPFHKILAGQTGGIFLHIPR